VQIINFEIYYLRTKVWSVKKSYGVEEETTQNYKCSIVAQPLPIHPPKNNIWGASSSCTPTYFFLHPHNFLNLETDLNLLFEKGHRSYRK